jgi:tRNA 2-selenouridine synthase
MREDTADYRALFVDNVPLLDVRAPIEFRKGAFPGAVNLPLLDDSERQKVGTCYTQRGQEAAVALGNQLVSGLIKASRLEAWKAYAQQHPAGYLYCFRGGLRSLTVQQWLAEAGISYPRVLGGYKALRNFLIHTLTSALQECRFIRVGGLTGTGKTEVLSRLPNAIDLERHANHRGSSFGKHATPQPSQVDFENRIAIDLLRQRASGRQHFVLEDEGPMVGSCSLPHDLYKRMQQSPLVWLEDSFEGRVSRILEDYVVKLHNEFTALLGADAGSGAFVQRLKESLASIAKRLGGERYQRLSALLDAALEEQLASGSVQSHRLWIEALLQEYYDPMYAFQQQRKQDCIVFSGSFPAVLEYLESHAP